MYSLKFYADCPEGESNKLFCYPVHHGGHAADLITRFMGKGFTIRAAFMVVEGSGTKGVQLAPVVLEHLAWSPGEMVARVKDELLTRFPLMVQTVR